MVVIGTITQRTQRLERLVLVALELLLFWRCAPVVAFAVFFCFWHTPEHLVASSTSRIGRFSIRTMRLQLRSGFLPWLVSLAGLCVFLTVGARELQLYSAKVFILLSALTVPHMLLNEARRPALHSHPHLCAGLNGR